MIKRVLYLKQAVKPSTYLVKKFKTFFLTNLQTFCKKVFICSIVAVA